VLLETINLNEKEFMEGKFLVNDCDLNYYKGKTVPLIAAITMNVPARENFIHRNLELKGKYPTKHAFLQKAIVDQARAQGE
jgi:hypothetical protein